MNKVMQAAGRVIRTIRDKGVIALLDDRFLNPQCVSLFPREWGTYTVVNRYNVGQAVNAFWDPGFMFAIGRVRAMFAFGWKLLLAALLDTLFNNLYGLIMGKIYNEELLGAYNRGDQFPKLIVNNLGAAIQAVLLPDFGMEIGNRLFLHLLCLYRILPKALLTEEKPKNCKICSYP